MLSNAENLGIEMTFRRSLCQRLTRCSSAGRRRASRVKLANSHRLHGISSLDIATPKQTVASSCVMAIRFDSTRVNISPRGLALHWPEVSPRRRLLYGLSPCSWGFLRRAFGRECSVRLSIFRRARERWGNSERRGDKYWRQGRERRRGDWRDHGRNRRRDEYGRQECWWCGSWRNHGRNRRRARRWFRGNSQWRQRGLQRLRGAGRRRDARHSVLHGPYGRHSLREGRLMPQRFRSILRLRPERLGLRKYLRRSTTALRKLQPRGALARDLWDRPRPIPVRQETTAIATALRTKAARASTARRRPVTAAVQSRARMGRGLRAQQPAPPA